MKTEVFAQSEDRAVKAAKALAEFANLRTEEEAREFSSSHKNFAPEDWWTGLNYSVSKGRMEHTWEQMQDHVREIWKKKFPYNLCIGMVNVGTYLSSMQEQYQYQETQRALYEEGKGNLAAVSDHVAFGFSKWPKVWDYQLAVMFLNVQSWRAKICELCGRFYIAESPNGRFCNFAKDNETMCFLKHREQSKKESREKNRKRTNDRRRAAHAAHKRSINAKRRAAYAALKAKAKKKFMSSSKRARVNQGD